MENYRQLYESMFNKNLADDDARDFLIDITQRYPFFSPAQFLLLHKTAKTDEHYQLQLLRTTVAFNNNYWLNYLLLQKDKDSFIDSFSAQETITDTPAELNQFNIISTEMETETAAFPNETEEIINTTSEVIDVTLPDTEHHGDEIVQVIEETQAVNNEIPAPSVDSEKFSLTDINPVEAKRETEDLGTTNDEVIEDITSDNAMAVDNDEKTAAPIGEAALSPAFDDIEASFELKDEFSRDAINAAFIDSDEQTESEENANEERFTTEDFNSQSAIDSTEQKEDSEEAFIAPLKTDLAEAAAILDTQPVENGPLFEPLHTTDYFASVGIKLGDELKPGDRLGNQLKSFTEWLKTMKKLPGHTNTAVLQEATEKQNHNIQQLAENSNKEDEIITEAMADVLMQQGRIDKAVEVLKKLSLLNPSKNTYFAAKIDKLKEE